MNGTKSPIDYLTAFFTLDHRETLFLVEELMIPSYLSKPLRALFDCSACLTVSSLLAMLVSSAIHPLSADANQTLESSPATRAVEPVTPDLRKAFSLGVHYQKSVTLHGFPILASSKVRDEALLEACWIVQSMLQARPDILETLAKNKIRLAVMAWDERTSDIPEHATLEPRAYWNRRARGLGPTSDSPCVSCGEENLLNYSGDPYDSENILIHEFAHAIHLMALNQTDPSFDKRLRQLHQSAKDKGMWKNTYAITNHVEYWAEATQSWFGNNRQNDTIHNHVNTREELITYDPAVAALCHEVYGNNPWQYQRSDHPERTKDPHLKSLDRKKLSAFRWTDDEEAAYKEHEQKK